MKKYLKFVFAVVLCLLVFTSCINEKDVAQNPNRSDELSCTLSVECKTALGKCSDKDDILPDDGVIYAGKTVPFESGETVFDLLKRELRSEGIHLEYSMTPVYDTAYIEEIGNLYEFDCGETSGWMFRVNEEFPGVGCSGVILEDGDTVEFVYSCDMGRDVGKSQ